jgi:hypothetical protein
MQLATNNGTAVITGGIMSRKNFSVAIDGKLFRILSNTLYQNKVGSMVRETACNASDSHTAAGKPEVPFVIHAPNAIEPWFSVKDLGVGLNHREVNNVFTVFGKSTKTESNDQVGAFGFGSKSPFAYTDSFTITAIKNGRKRMYSAIVQEDGTPAVMLLDVERTDEPNGVEIMVGVQSYDFDDFQNEIMEQLAFFKTKPIVVGNTRVKFKDMFADVIETVDNVYFRNSKPYRCQPLVVQGGVSYPLDLDEVRKAAKDKKEFSHFLTNIVAHNSPIIVFDIGKIEVTPSREAISYSKHTLANIIETLESVQSKLESNLEAKMDGFATQWERAVFLRGCRDLYASVINFETNKWGIKCHGDDPYITSPDCIKTTAEDAKGRTRNALTRYSGDETRAGRFRMSVEDTNTIIPDTNVVFVIADGSTVAQGRVRRFVEEQEKTVYLLRSYYSELEQIHISKDEFGVPIKDADGNELARKVWGNWYQCTPSAAVVAEVKAYFVGAEFKMLADLPKPEREIRVIENGEEVVKPKYVPAKMYKFTGFNCGYNLSFKNFEKVYTAAKKSTDECAYVLVENRTVTSGVTDQAHFNLLVTMLREDAFDKPIYAIRQADIEKIKDNPAWVPLHVEIANRKIALLQKYKKSHVYYAIKANRGDGLETFVSRGFMEFIADTTLAIHDPQLRRIAKIRKRNQYQHLARAVIDPIGTSMYVHEINAIADRLRKKEKALCTAVKAKYSVLRNVHEGYHADFPEEFYAEILEWLNYQYNKKALA